MTKRTFIEEYKKLLVHLDYQVTEEIVADALVLYTDWYIARGF